MFAPFQELSLAHDRDCVQFDAVAILSGVERLVESTVRKFFRLSIAFLSRALAAEIAWSHSGDSSKRVASHANK